MCFQLYFGAVVVLTDRGSALLSASGCRGVATETANVSHVIKAACLLSWLRGAAHEPAQDAAVTQLSNQEQPQQQQEQPQLLQEQPQQQQEQPQQQQEQPQQQQEQPQLHEVHEEAVVLGFTPEYEEELPINMY